MYCVRCNNHIVDCTCHDIEERLKSLANGPAAPAALQNLMDRRAKQAKEQEKHEPKQN